MQFNDLLRSYFPISDTIPVVQIPFKLVGYFHHQLLPTTRFVVGF